MQKAAESFYKAASKYKPTYYWLDVEEKTMEDMNAGVEAFRAKLASLGAKNIGIYVGTYFLEEHSISTKKFTAIWIPTYGYNDGYYNAAPKTDLKYDLHQYTSQGSISGFAHDVDLNQLSPLKIRQKRLKNYLVIENNDSVMVFSKNFTEFFSSSTPFITTFLFLNMI